MNVTLLIPIAIYLISWWRPKYGLAAIILIWPGYLMRLDIIGIPTTVLELSLYALALAVAISIVSKRLTSLTVKISRWGWWLLLAWVGAWLLATAYSPDLTASLGAFKAWLVDPILFSALMIVLIKNKDDQKFVIKATILSGVAVAVFGLYQMIWWRETLQDGRLSSFFHPVANYAAMFLVPILILNGGLLLYRSLKGFGWWISLGLMALAIILTMSYGGFFSLAVGGIFLWAYLPSGKLKKNLALSATAIGLIGLLALSTTNNFAEHFKSTDRSSSLVRGQIWVTAWALIEKNPLLGIGPNNFEAAYRVEIPDHYFPPLEWLVAQPHNLYLALWLETGLIGLVVFLISIIRHGYILHRNFITSPTDRTIAIISLAALSTILAHGLVDTPYFKNDLALEYMLVVLWPWLGLAKTKLL